MATAELAVVLPAVLLVLAVALSALGLAIDQIRCVDAARAGARPRPRGDAVAAVAAVAARGAPAGASVATGTSGRLVTVTVTAPPAQPGRSGPGGGAAGCQRDGPARVGGGGPP